MAYSQSPFRLAQALRCICGRGYSGKGWSTFTFSAQTVVMRSPAIAQGAWAEAEYEQEEKEK